MKTKQLVTTAVAAGVALALVGCTSGATPDSSNSDEPAEITFLTFQSPNLDEAFWEEQIANIEEIYPNLTVNIEYTPGLDRQGYAKQLLATGTLPDVIWDAPIRDFVDAGALLPYEPEDLAGIDAPDTAGVVNGEHYTLTVGAQAIPLMYYNKDLFAELGLEVPTTWAELLDVAEAIHQSGTSPFLLGGGADSWATTMFLDGIITADVLGQDPDWMIKRAKGEVSFSDPEFRSAVEKWVGLNADGYFNSDALSLDYSKLQAAFAAQQGAMYPMGSWAGATQADFEVGVFPLPSETDDVTLGVNYGQALAISATTKFPEQARAFAVALATSQATATAQLIGDALIPVAKDVTMPDDVTPLIAATVEAYNTEGAQHVEPFGWTQGQNAFPSGFDAEFNKAAQALFLDGNVDAFLAAIDAAYDDLNEG